MRIFTKKASNSIKLHGANHRWQIVEGIVDTTNDYIKVVYDDFTIPYALLGLGNKRTVIVQYFCGEKFWKLVVQKALRKIKSEIAYYFYEKGENNPWKFLLHYSSANAPTNQIRWIPFLGGNQEPLANDRNERWENKDERDVIHKTALVQYRKARAHLDIKEFEEALDALNRAIEIEPYHSNWYVYRGITFRILERIELALNDFAKALEIESDNAFAYYSRSYCYYQIDRDEDALIDCNKTIELEPEDDAHYANRGMLYVKRKEFDKAVIDYKKAIELNPNETFLYDTIANIYLEMGNFDLANDAIEKSLKMNPCNIHAFATQAQIKSDAQNDNKLV